MPTYASEPLDCVHEVELGVIMNGKAAKNCQNWEERIAAYCLLLDMTNMSQMKESRATGTPWFMGKVQHGFLVLGDLIAKEKIADPHQVLLELKKNGQVAMGDLTGNMHFKIDQQIEYIESKGVTLGEGDLIMSGCPEGIAPVNEGDLLEASMKCAKSGETLSQIVTRVGRE